VGQAGAEEIVPPAIRIPELIQDGRIAPGELIHVQVETRHPSRTGLVIRDGKFVRASEPFYLDEMEVSYCGERVSRFELTSALSDDPLITFSLLATREGPLQVRLKNNRGQRFEARHEIDFS
jgi:hypothetical protein